MKSILTAPGLPRAMAEEIKAALPSVLESGNKIYDRKSQKIYRFRVDEVDLVAKTYQITKPSRVIAAHLGFSRARRSFRAGLLLSKAGIHTPRPLLLQEEGRMIYSSSVLVTEFCEGLSLERLLASGQTIPEHLLDHLAGILIKFRQHNIRHGDLHCLNILVSPDGYPCVIDLDGTRKRFMKRKAQKNFIEDRERLLSSLKNYPDFQASLTKKVKDIV